MIQQSKIKFPLISTVVNSIFSPKKVRSLSLLDYGDIITFFSTYFTFLGSKIPDYCTKKQLALCITYYPLRVVSFSLRYLNYTKLANRSELQRETYNIK